jgi:drug/metabolite transporter (DMT)-like permease
VTPTGVGFGVGAALSWGVSDFSGGLASRRATPLATVVVSQTVGVVGAIVALGLLGERYPGGEPIGWAVVGGIAAFVSLVSFYRSLAYGAMGLAAAVTGVIGAGLPVVVGAVTGDQLRPTDALGIAVALVAVVLVARPANDIGIGRESLTFAVVAGVGAGVFFIAMGRSTAAGGETWWPVAISRAIVLGLAVISTIGLRRVGTTVRSASPLMVVIGFGDLLGTAFFVAATGLGALSVSAVVASQYPAVTAVLARVLANERLAPTHVAGIVLALVAIALIALP